MMVDTKAAAIVAATISLAACTTDTPHAGPTTVTVTMNTGKGGLSATAVTPEPLVQLGRADLPFTVV